MKWREVTQYSELLSSQSSVNNANRNNNNGNHQQDEKALSFTSKTETILRQVWDSKFIFTKRSLVCCLLGRNIKIPDQNGKKPPATLKGYLAFQHEKIVQMFVCQMIAKQIFTQKKIQTSGKRSKNIIEPMPLEEFYLIKNSNLSSRLIIQIPLSVIKNLEVRQKSGQKKQSRFSQFLVKKKQKQEDQVQDEDCEEFLQNANQHKILQQRKKSAQSSKQKSLDLSKSKQENKQFKMNQNNQINKSKVFLQSFGFGSKKNNIKNQNQNLIPKAQNNLPQKLNAINQQQKMKQFWQRQNKPLFQQFGQIKDQPNEIKINNNGKQSKQQMISMMRQIKDKEKIKKINIPSQFFKKPQTKPTNSFNFYKIPYQNQKKEFILQSDLGQKKEEKRNEYTQKLTQKLFNSKIVERGEVKTQRKRQSDIFANHQRFNCIDLCSSNSYQNKNNFQHFKKEQNSINSKQQIDQGQIFDYIFQNIKTQTQKRESNKKQVNNTNTQQSRIITLQNRQFKNNQNQIQNDRRSSGNSSHSDSVRLKQYFDNGQIGKFWDQIFQNPKFNTHLTQNTKRHSQYSQCVQIPEESQNTQTMTMQRANQNNANHDCDFRDISYQQPNNSMTKTIFPHNLNKSFPQQINFNFQQNNYGNGPIRASFKMNNNVFRPDNRKNNAIFIQRQNQNWRRQSSRNLNNLNHQNQQNNNQLRQNPYLFQVDSDYSDGFDKTKTVPISNNKNGFNSSCRQQQFNGNKVNNYSNNNRNNNGFELQKFEIQYPKPIEQIQRSTYTLTVGDRLSNNSFYYSPQRQEQPQEQQFYQRNQRQSLGQHTVTLIRKPFHNQQLRQLQRQNKGRRSDQYQNYKRFKNYNPIQELDI